MKMEEIEGKIEGIKYVKGCIEDDLESFINDTDDDIERLKGYLERIDMFINAKELIDSDIERFRDKISNLLDLSIKERSDCRTLKELLDCYDNAGKTGNLIIKRR